MYIRKGRVSEYQRKRETASEGVSAILYRVHINIMLVKTHKKLNKIFIQSKYIKSLFVVHISESKKYISIISSR